jgi:hypothetical protein
MREKKLFSGVSVKAEHREPLEKGNVPCAMVFKRGF